MAVLVAVWGVAFVGAPAMAEQAPGPGGGAGVGASQPPPQRGPVWTRPLLTSGTDNDVEQLAPGVAVTLREGGMRPLFVPPGTDVTQVRVVDEVTGHEVPLTTRTPVSARAAGVFVLLPTLPRGVFTVTVPGGTATVVVGEPDVEPGSAASVSHASPGLAFVVVGAVLLVAVAGAGVLLRRSRLRLAAGAAGAGLAVAVAAGVGVVTVTSTPAVAADPAVSWQLCPSADVHCKATVLMGLRRERGDAAVAQFVSTVEGSDCHNVAHEFGFETWRRDPTPANAAVRAGSSGACGLGVVHGTAEAIATFASDADLARAVVDFCGRLSDPLRQASCFHGAGHGTIWRSNGDLLAAYALCDAQVALWPQSDCHGSAVMEWGDRWSQARDARARALVTPQLATIGEVCGKGPAEFTFRMTCYLGTNHRSWTPPQAAQWCAEHERGDGQVGCFRALGQNFLNWAPFYTADGQYIWDDYETAVTVAREHRVVCDVGAGRARQECSTAVVRAVMSAWSAHAVEQDVCGAFPTDLVAACRAEVGDRRAMRPEQAGSVTAAAG